MGRAANERKNMTIHRWFHRFLTGGAFVVAIAIGLIGNVGPVNAETAMALVGEEELDEQDPWEPFNEKVFSFNRQADRFLLKPIATGYDWVLPDPVQSSVGNALDNLDVVRRLTNNILQLKFAGAGREVARFTINSTIGIAGLFDVANDEFGIRQVDEDTGQTLGYYGIEPGPYLVLPFLPVTTVRDGIGFIADTAMNPLNYFIPIGATLGKSGTDTVNERSVNLDEFQRVEETTIDLYSAVRNAYLQRREAAIEE
ncbi:MAG: VacJ family lipoprotein [Candidatus Binatia bacterium]